MSLEGIKRVAGVFSIMQETRGSMIRECTRDGLLDKQDLMLAQLLETGKDAMKIRFTEITMMKESEK